ncbi:hypothetical protein ABZ805_08705 [Saccharopolyspora sp. NPDC047091]|uniref:hypothetical protein n=1 Tax=Saccharopolyspora sp. NPDC047091 TaxID=3155924 RepID=UPI00340769C6
MAEAEISADVSGPDAGPLTLPALTCTRPWSPSGADQVEPHVFGVASFVGGTVEQGLAGGITEIVAVVRDSFHLCVVTPMEVVGW